MSIGWTTFSKARPGKYGDNCRDFEDLDLGSLPVLYFTAKAGLYRKVELASWGLGILGLGVRVKWFLKCFC